MKCVLIGLGMVAGTHVAALRDAKDVSLLGVLARDPDKARAFAQTHDAGQAFASLADVIAAKPDFVILATPPDTRLEYVTACVDAGIPILMEKPIERTLDAAKQIVDLCGTANIPLGVVFQHRARAASQALKDAIAHGVLGDITNAEIRVPWWRDQSYYDAPGRGTFARDGGGVMITQAIHTLDLALWLMGPVSHVQAMMHTTKLHRLEAEDWAGGLLSFQNGAVASLTATTSAFPGSSESLTLQGTKAAAHLAEGVLTLHHLDGRIEKIGASATTGGGADPMAFTHAWHQTIIEDFAVAIAENRAPMAPGYEALQTHAVIDAMQQASNSGQRTKVTL